MVAVDQCGLAPLVLSKQLAGTPVRRSDVRHRPDDRHDDVDYGDVVDGDDHVDMEQLAGVPLGQSQLGHQGRSSSWSFAGHQIWMEVCWSISEAVDC